MADRVSLIKRYVLPGIPAVAAVLAGCQAGSLQSGSSSQPDDAQQSTSGELQQAQKAVAGVGRSGASLRKHTDAQKIISGPASELLQFRQKAVLEIQIPHALELFKATEGRYPNSHQEFMEKIVRANRLTLPELPEGMVYRFNPEKGELWVYPEEEAP